MYYIVQYYLVPTLRHVFKKEYCLSDLFLINNYSYQCYYIVLLSFDSDVFINFILRSRCRQIGVDIVEVAIFCFGTYVVESFARRF